MKQVRIAELKAHLSEYLREARSGHPLVVMDRDTPVARIVPYDPDPQLLRVRRPTGRHGSIQDVPLPRPLRLGIDVVEVLLEERQGER